MGFSFNFNQDGEPAPAPSVQNPDPAGAPPELHSLDSILESLVDVTVSFDKSITKAGPIYRRHLFDVRHQAMAEAADELDEVQSILLENSDDLRKNVYEGGFKLWECSYDLVEELSVQKLPYNAYLELGCGTALPLCFLLNYLLSTKTPGKLVLSDYNSHVLRLVTVPNLVINWAHTIESSTIIGMQPHSREGELVFTRELLQMFKHCINGIEITLISGAWGDAFSRLISPLHIDCIVSSETIYSPPTVPIFLDMLEPVLSSGATAFIAAKHYYFGVGGLIREFVELATRRHMHVETVQEGKGLLKRAVLRVVMSR